MAAVNSDSDDDLIIQDEEADRSRQESLQSRLDEYLNASKLGRLAYDAGDIRLATDRFNLALDIELQVELESFNDFGVTGQILRQKLSQKTDSTEDESKEEKPPYYRILHKLKSLYEKADKASALDPTEPKWYLHMGAALCSLNEWEKAKIIYTEGIVNCSQENSTMIQKELNRLQKLEEMMAVLGTRFERETTSPDSPKFRRRRQSSVDNSELNNVPRSFSFTLDRKLKKTPSPLSPLAHKQPGTVSASSSSYKKRGSLFTIFKKGKAPLSHQHSWSSEDLSSNGKIDSHRERTDWKDLFTSAECASQFNRCSRTIESMRTINALIY